MGIPEKKVVLRLDLHDDKAKQKAMKAVSTVSGIDSMSMDMKDKKMTVIGLVDPVSLVSKLRKSWRTEILSIGPAKEPKPEEEKKEEPKEEPKEEEKKELEAKKEEEPKKEEPKREDEEKEELKKEEPKKDEKKELEHKKEAEKKDPNEQLAEFIKMYRFYYPYMTTRYAAHSSVEEDPNPCTIF